MTLEEAIGQQAVWVPIWVVVLTAISIVVPVALLFWRASRLAGILSLIAMVIAGLGVQWLFDQHGYVGLIALPHVLLWTPLVVYLVHVARGADMPEMPRILIYAMAITLIVSLLFDYASVLGYVTGRA